MFHFKKSQNFLGICSLLGKNPTNFDSPNWKLHNRYCHTGHGSNFLFILTRPNSDVICISYLKDFVASMTSFNFDFLDRQKQIIRQHICSLSDQDKQKIKQMSSAEIRQYCCQRNLLITNTNSYENIITNTMQIQHTTKGKFYFDKKKMVSWIFLFLILIINFFLHILYFKILLPIYLRSKDRKKVLQI